MRGVATVVVAVAVLTAGFSPLPADSADALRLTIQIHDYSRVPGGSLSHASAIVTRIFGKIGVQTEWIGVERGEDLLARAERHDATSRPSRAQLTLIILTPKMAARAGVADGVLGYAAVPAEGMGRIAFAIYDRVRSAAARIPLNEGELLGFVMAHEIGHLVLPGDSPADTGPMKNHWDVRDLRGLDLRRLEFSEQQASVIRSTIENAGTH
jgi:hypothetical protein